MRRVRPCGPGALLVECESADDALGLWRRLDAERPTGVDEVVPGARTVLVVGAIDEHTRSVIASLAGTAPGQDAGRLVTIEVVYDGADLDAVATATGMSVTQVVELHAAAVYTVAFGGFVPGFAYLTGLAEELSLPRRPSPRTRVPAGSVAIADVYTAVYPVASPGGWHLLGHTERVMFDAGREPPATLRPGDRVRFQPAG